jgi:putative NADH-flavin reductase
VKRLLVVGGAGSLYVAPGVQLVDTPTFPAEWKQGALAAREALNLIRQESSLDWTFVSPAVFLEPGERTGRFRLGGDEVLMSGEQPARISVADLAVAIVDEIEKPQHLQKRFTAGY